MNILALFGQASAFPFLLADGGVVVGGFIALWIVVAILALAATVFWVWMLIDVLTSSMDTGEKILWVLVIFFLHFVGALIYYFVARSNRARSLPAP